MDTDCGDRSGSAYLFVRDGQSWTEQAILTAGDAAVFNLFGSSVSISGDLAVVGAPPFDDIINDVGAAYVYSVASQ